MSTDIVFLIRCPHCREGDIKAHLCRDAPLFKGRCCKCGQEIEMSVVEAIRERYDFKINVFHDETMSNSIYINIINTINWKGEIFLLPGLIIDNFYGYLFIEGEMLGDVSNFDIRVIVPDSLVFKITTRWGNLEDWQEFYNLMKRVVNCLRDTHGTMYEDWERVYKTVWQAYASIKVSKGLKS